MNSRGAPRLSGEVGNRYRRLLWAESASTGFIIEEPCSNAASEWRGRTSSRIIPSDTPT